MTSTASAAAASTAMTTMRSSTASTFFTTRPRATGDFSHGRRGRGVRYSRTIVNAYHVSLSCMQSPCAHHAPRWRRRVVSFCWCSFAALPKRLPLLPGVAAEEAPHPLPSLRHLQVLLLGVATAAAAATASAAAGGLSMLPSRN